MTHKTEENDFFCTIIMTVSYLGLCVGIGVGFLRHLHVTNDFVIDIICADYVTNTTLAAIRFTANKYEMLKKVPEPEVYHVTSKGFYLTSGKTTFFFYVSFFLSLYFSENCTFVSSSFFKYSLDFFSFPKKPNKQEKTKNL